MILWYSFMMVKQVVLILILQGGQEVRERFLDLKNEQVLEGACELQMEGRV